MNEIAPFNSTPGTAPDAATHASAILRLLDRPIGQAELDAGTALAARPEDAGRGQAIRLLLFRIGDEAAAIPAKQLRRVTPLARPSPIPHRSSRVLRGICNIRGEIVLCADLHRLLGLPDRVETAVPQETSADPRRMVVIGPPDNSWAFEVDALLGVESVDPASFRAPPITVEYSLGDFTLGVTEIGGRSVTILDGERLLGGFKAGLA
jgi:chemotaxis signal transduction protein